MSDEHRWRRKCFVICLLALFIGLMGIVLPEIVFTPKIYINATNITAVGAASTSSPDIFNISEIDNFNFSLVESTTPWYINITFTNITNFSYLETKSMYFATTGAPSQHEVDIEMWCDTEQEFVDLSSLTSHIEWFYFTRNFPESMHFIDSAGNVTVRFNHSDTGNTNHRLYIDTVRLITSTQYEQVNINQTIIQNGCVGDCAFNNLTVNSLGKNDTSDYFISNIHLISPFFQYGIGEAFFSKIDISDGYTNLLTTRASDNNYSNIYKTPELIRMEVSNANNNFFEIRQNESVYDVLGRVYTYNYSDFDIGGANLTNCANCGTGTDNTKVNKTGDNMTGKLNFTGTYPTRASLMDGNGIITVYNNSVMRSQLSGNGIQEWKLNNNSADVGYVLYTTPLLNIGGIAEGAPGILFRNATVGQRVQMALVPYALGGGFQMYASQTTSANVNTTTILDQRDGGTIRIDALAGTGDAYVCVDSTGKLFRKASTCA